MGHLLDPGSGDILDRLSILALKIVHGSPDRTAHFAEERQQLLVRLHQRVGNEPFWLFVAHMLALAAINAAMWQATDEMNGVLSKKPTTKTSRQAGEIALRLFRWNRERAALIARINGPGAGEEKL